MLYRQIVFLTALSLLLTACDSHNKPPMPKVDEPPAQQQEVQPQKPSSGNVSAPQTDDIVINNPKLMALLAQNEQTTLDNKINDISPPPSTEIKPEPAVTSTSSETALRINIAETEQKLNQESINPAVAGTQSPAQNNTFPPSTEPEQASTALLTQPGVEQANTNRTPSPILRESYTDKNVDQEIKKKLTANTDDEINMDNMPTPVIHSQPVPTTKPAESTKTTEQDVAPTPPATQDSIPTRLQQVPVLPPPATDPAGQPNKPFNQSELNQTQQVYAEISKMKDEIHSMIYSLEPIDEVDVESVG